MRSASSDVEVYDFDGTSYVLAASFAAQPGTIGALDYDTAASPADGIDDIVVGSSTGTSDLEVHQSDGAGTFTLAGTLPRNSDAPSAGFARASFDGSGSNDFAVAGATPVVSAYAGEGGAYATGETGVAGGSSALTTPAVGDFDADGLDDYAILTSVLTTFSRPAAAASYLPTQTRTITTGDYDVLSAISLDFGSDGRDDLLVYGSDGDISVYRSDATPPQTRSPTVRRRWRARRRPRSRSRPTRARRSSAGSTQRTAATGAPASHRSRTAAWPPGRTPSRCARPTAPATSRRRRTAPPGRSIPRPGGAGGGTARQRRGANDATPAYAGTAESGSTVTVIVDGTPVGTTTADGSGDWTLTQPTDLAEGVHTVRATATDAAGNTSPTSNTNSFTVDATHPPRRR